MGSVGSIGNKEWVTLPAWGAFRVSIISGEELGRYNISPKMMAPIYNKCFPMLGMMIRSHIDSPR